MKKTTSNPNSNTSIAIWKFFFKIFDNLFGSFNIVKIIKNNNLIMTIITLAIIFSFGVAHAQIGPATAPVDPPDGGFNIDGTLRANSNIGDWLYGSGTGDFVLDLNGNPLVPETTFHLIDLYNNSLDNIFGGGVKIDDNPNNWSWVSGTANDKTDMNNALIHFTTDNNGHVWIVFAADRLGGENSSAYMDFEFLQSPMTLTSTGFSTSASYLTGGRTDGDFILTVYFENGIAKFDIQSWQNDGGVWKYVSIYSYLPPNAVYAAGNTVPVSVPYTAFGLTTYSNNTFIESAVDLTAVLQDIDPCADILVKTIFVKSKTSTSSSAQLKDFFEPLQVDFHLVTPGGSVSGGGAICSGETSGLLELSNHIGTVVKWQSSVDPFNNWTDIVNTSTTYTSEPLTETTKFRAVVTGICGEVESDPATVTVNPLPLGTNKTLTIDSGDTLNENIASNVNISGSIYSWQAGDNTNIIGETTTLSSASSITDTLTNLTGSIQDVIYTITPTSPFGCVGNSFTITVHVNPKLPTISINDQLNVNEGSVANFTVILSNTYIYSVTFTVNTQDGTAVAPGDYVPISGANYSIPAGQTTVNIPVTINNDNIYETTDETYQVVLSNVKITTTNIDITTTDLIGDGSIVNTTTAPVVSIVSTTQASEPNNDGLFAVNLTDPVSVPTTVTYTITGTANNGVDYQTITSTLVIPALSTSVTIPVIVIDDNIIEATETVIITLISTNTLVTVDPTKNIATVTILDNDGGSENGISINDITVNE
ncbi:MAG: PKD-like domain-containing protein, partial [Lutibacter sp.]|nr:PKD-like domain-containing protein [Lutibacter sp.]